MSYLNQGQGKILARQLEDCAVSQYIPPTTLENIQQRVADTAKKLEELKEIEHLLKKYPDIDRIMSLLGRNL